MTSVKELRTKQEQLASEARSILDQITPDLDAGRAAELNEQADKAFAAFDQIEARVERETRAAEMAARLSAPDGRRPVGEARGVSAGEQRGETVETAFRSYLLHGKSGLTNEQRSLLMPAQVEGRAMSVGTASAGGYTVPTTLSGEIVKSMKAWGPMLDPGVTRELTTERGETISWPTMDDTASVATIIGENTEVDPTPSTGNAPGDLAFGAKSLKAFKYTTGLIRVSAELAQDNIVNLESVIRDAMAERLGRGVNAHLTVGGGTTAPWGIATRSTLGRTAPDVSTVPTVTFDDLIELQHSVDPAYRADPSCAFMFNDGTLKALRKIKDLEGNYIWQPANAAVGAPSSILGHRYVVNQAMGGILAATRSVIFGAMNRYIVRRVRGLSIVRLDERYAEFGQIAFIGFARFDGDLMDTAGVKHIVQET